MWQPCSNRIYRTPPSLMGLQSLLDKIFKNRSSEYIPDNNSSSYGNAANTGWRLMLHASQPIPKTLQGILGGDLALYTDDRAPVYIASAHMGNSGVHPCKYIPNSGVLVPYGGEECKHEGRFDVLLFDSERMEWVSTSNGQVPAGRRPVDGGFEENGLPLYHALWTINHDTSVPGKTGEHLGACHVAFRHSELVVKDGYKILCWKPSNPSSSAHLSSHSSQGPLTTSSTSPRSNDKDYRHNDI